MKLLNLMRYSTGIALMGLALQVSAAPFAQITNVKGNCLVKKANNGAVMALAAGANSTASVGDTLVCHENSSAKLTYANCQQTVSNNHFVSISRAKACAAPRPLHQGQQAAGQTGKIARIDPSTAGASCTACKVGLANSLKLKGVLLAAGVVGGGIILANTGGGSDSSISSTP